MWQVQENMHTCSEHHICNAMAQHFKHENKLYLCVIIRYATHWPFQNVIKAYDIIHGCL
jgi:hypothetical protein